MLNSIKLLLRLLNHLFCNGIPQTDIGLGYCLGLELACLHYNFASASAIGRHFLGLIFFVWFMVDGPLPNAYFHFSLLYSPPERVRELLQRAYLVLPQLKYCFVVVPAGKVAANFRGKLVRRTFFCGSFKLVFVVVFS